MSGQSKQNPPEFEQARSQILSAKFRSELFTEETTSPDRISPFSVALAAGVKHSATSSADTDSEAGVGRFILLYDPESANEWGEKFRVVCYAQAPLETEIGADPFITDVTWSWLTDALSSSGAEYKNIAGTATIITSTGFGGLEAQGTGSQIELRASWTPMGEHFSAHAVAWSHLLCFLAGFPEEEGAISIDAYRIKNKKST
ncbi:MAG TPA: DUF3000 domain-containing protein [Microbacteriaceae bacterium]|nr:DUF3000 domain-containing protein [Microbacteriaceae bacterium]